MSKPKISPKIRHLAIMTLDPERLAKFYEQTFEMKRLTGKGVPGSKAVYMTDGYITLALLENKADGKPSRYFPDWVSTPFNGWPSGLASTTPIALASA